MFESGTEESGTSEVKVPDIKAAVFRGLLEFLYSDSLPKNFDAVAFDLLLAADKYSVEKLVKMCESKAPLSARNVVDALLVADRVESHVLMERAKVVSRSSFDTVMKCDAAKKKLKRFPDLLLELLSHYLKD